MQTVTSNNSIPPIVTTFTSKYPRSAANITAALEKPYGWSTSSTASYSTWAPSNSKRINNRTRKISSLQQTLVHGLEANPSLISAHPCPVVEVQAFRPAVPRMGQAVPPKWPRNLGCLRPVHIVYFTYSWPFSTLSINILTRINTACCTTSFTPPPLASAPRFQIRHAHPLSLDCYQLYIVIVAKPYA